MALARNPRADGAFVLAVRTTGIYCRPSCPARRPLRRNVVFFRSCEEAEGAGFRACLRCCPKELARSVSLVTAACRQFARTDGNALRVNAIAKNLGVSPAVLRRAFSDVTGLTPRDLAELPRLAQFKKLLRSGKNITDALYDAGYGSPSRVYEHSNARLGMTPAAYRKGGAGMNIFYTVAKLFVGKNFGGRDAKRNFRGLSWG